MKCYFEFWNAFALNSRYTENVICSKLSLPLFSPEQNSFKHNETSFLPAYIVNHFELRIVTGIYLYNKYESVFTEAKQIRWKRNLNSNYSASIRDYTYRFFIFLCFDMKKPHWADKTNCITVLLLMIVLFCHQCFKNWVNDPWNEFSGLILLNRNAFIYKCWRRMRLYVTEAKHILKIFITFLTDLFYE